MIAGERWDSDSGAKTYAQIRRRGRTWDSSGGRKEKLAPVHVDRHPPASLFVDDLGKPTELYRALECLTNAQCMDRLVRTLYEADGRQTVAVAGLIHHLLAGARTRLAEGGTRA